MKLDYKRTFFVGLAFLSICAFWQMYDNIIPLMLKNNFHLNDMVIGAVMALDNVLALFMLPLFGAFSDKVNTRYGKRMPFIVIGTILAVVSMTFIPIAAHQTNLVMFMVFLGIVLVAMGSYRSPTVALMPDITPKPLRSKANAVINLMGAIGGVYTLIMIIVLVKDEDKYSYAKVFLSVSLIMAIAVIILFFTINERKMSQTDQEEIIITKKKEEESKKSMVKYFMGMPLEVRTSFFFLLASVFFWFFAYNAITTAFSRYAQVVWGLKEGGFATPLLIATIASIFSYIPIGNIACRVGRKKSILAGIIIMTVTYLMGMIFLHYSSWVNVVFAFTGIGWAAINVNSYPMIVEMCKGSDIGKYTGIYYIFSMSAQIITPIVSGAFMKYISYRSLFPYAVLFSVVSFCTMLFVKHGDSKPERKKDLLENYDSED